MSKLPTTRILPDLSQAPAVSNIAIAPRTGEQGKRLSYGGHIEAYKAQPKFPLDAPVALVPGTSNPWRLGTVGSEFYTSVLAKLPANAKVSDALALAAKAGFKPVQAQGHLRWLFTYSAGYISIGGKLGPMVGVPAAPKAPAKGKRSKVSA